MMKNEIAEFCDQHSACREGREWALTQSSLADVFDNCVRGDWLMWMLQKGGGIEKRACVQLACEFALRVLPNYESKYNRTEPRKAIDAALAWLDDMSEANASAAYSAASAARAAARAADSAASAARAAARADQCKIIRSVVANPWRAK